METLEEKEEVGASHSSEEPAKKRRKRGMAAQPTEQSRARACVLRVASTSCCTHGDTSLW